MNDSNPSLCRSEHSENIRKNRWEHATYLEGGDDVFRGDRLLGLLLAYFVRFGRDQVDEFWGGGHAAPIIGVKGQSIRRALGAAAREGRE